MTPITKAIDALNRQTLDRHSWLSPASEQIRRWRKEDEAKGLFWTTREAADMPNKRAATDHE